METINGIDLLIGVLGVAVGLWINRDPKGRKRPKRTEQDIKALLNQFAEAERNAKINAKK